MMKPETRTVGVANGSSYEKPIVPTPEERTIALPCDCGCSVLVGMASWELHTGNPRAAYIDVFTHYPPMGRWRDRLEAAWHALRGHEFDFSCVMLRPPAARMFRDWLDDVLTNLSVVREKSSKG